MPAHRILPDDDTLLALVAAGLSHRAIGRLYDVGQASVSRTLRRAGVGKAFTPGLRMLPWDIDPRHRRCHPAEMLRCLYRRDNRVGRPLPPSQQHRLERWLDRWMGHVVCYHPRYGFTYQPRTLADGNLMYRPWRITRTGDKTR